MRPSGPIADFLAALARELRFDPALASRIGREVEDHLREALAGEPDGAGSEAERRVIVRFGDVRELARALAVDALLAQTRQVGHLMMMALAGVFLAMKVRVVWYALTHWALNGGLKAIYPIALVADRYAFATALALALGAFAFMGARRPPADFRRRHARKLRRGAAVCAIAAGALMLSVGIDAAMTGLRLAAADLTLSAIVPALTLAAEIGFAGLLGVNIFAAIRRAAGAISLLES